MRTFLRKKIGERLLDEADHVLEVYYLQKLEEVITDLRIRCIIDKDATESLEILNGLHSSKILYQISDEPAVHLRNAIARFVSGEFGHCKNCENPIHESWLLRSPLLEYCSNCMVKVKPSNTEMGIRDRQYEQINEI